MVLPVTDTTVLALAALASHHHLLIDRAPYRIPKGVNVGCNEEEDYHFLNVH